MQILSRAKPKPREKLFFISVRNRHNLQTDPFSVWENYFCFLLMAHKVSFAFSNHPPLKISLLKQSMAFLGEKFLKTKNLIMNTKYAFKILHLSYRTQSPSNFLLI